MEMICLNCGAVFIYDGFDRTIYCTNCGSSYTASKITVDKRIGFEKELKELRKKWNYYL